MGLSAIHNLDHTVIFCSDIHVMRDFYRDVLGFVIEEERPRWITFRVGGTRLSLAAPASTRRRPSADGPSVQLAFRVPPSALDECAVELAGRGVHLESQPRDLPEWGHRALFFADPEGNRLEIYAEVVPSAPLSR